MDRDLRRTHPARLLGDHPPGVSAHDRELCATALEDAEAQRDRAERRPRALHGDAKRRQEHLDDQENEGIALNALRDRTRGRLISTNPIRGVRIPAPLVEEVPDEDRAKALTRAELATLLSVIPEDWHLFFEFLVHTGLRISEMIGLTWEHMELEINSHVKVREQFYRSQRRRLKSGSGRRDIPLAPRMTARLIVHREATYSGPKEPVFTSDVGIELIRGKVADRVLNPARALVGMPWVSFHTFRHTCASLLFANGKDIKQIQTWLGHADAAFTLRTYVHLLEEGVGSADFLDDAVEVGRGPWARS